MMFSSITPHLLQLLVPLQYMEAQWRDGVSLEDAVARVFAGVDGALQPAEASRVFGRYLDQLRTVLNPGLLLQLVSEDFAVAWLGLRLEEEEDAAEAQAEEEAAQDERRPDAAVSGMPNTSRGAASTLPQQVSYIPVMPDVQLRGDHSPASDAEQ